MLMMAEDGVVVEERDEGQERRAMNKGAAASFLSSWSREQVVGGVSLCVCVCVCVICDHR